MPDQEGHCLLPRPAEVSGVLNCSELVNSKWKPSGDLSQNRATAPKQITAATVKQNLAILFSFLTGI